MKSVAARHIFLVSALLYLVSAAGFVDTIDADPSIETAKSLLDSFSPFVRIPYANPHLYARHPNGTVVSKLGLTTPILYLIPVALGREISDRFQLTEKVAIDFCVSFVNSFVTAAIVTLLFLFFREYLSPGSAAFLAFLVAFSTLLFPYAKTAHREPLQALCLLSAYFFAKRGKWEGCFLSGLSILLAILTKQILAVCLFPLGVWIWVCKTSKERVLFLIPLLFGALTYFLIGRQLFGSPWGTGYSAAVMDPTSHIWSVPFLTGMGAQWISLDTGLLIFNPILLLILGLWIAKMRNRRWGSFDSVVVITIVLQTMVHARWVTPTGGSALGPRYLVAVLPLFFLAIDFDVWAKLPRRFLIAVAIPCVFFQFVNVGVKAQQYWTLKQFAFTQRVRPEDYWSGFLWSRPDEDRIISSISGVELSFPHPLANLEFFLNKLQRREERYRLSNFGSQSSRVIDLGAFRSLQGFNFWWLHIARNASLNG